MKKNLLEDGTVLTLGLVGAVAAIGAMKKRGSRSVATASVMEEILDHLNDQGFHFEMMDDYLLVDDEAQISISAESPLDEDEAASMVSVGLRKLDRNGNLVGMNIVGDFRTDDLDGISRSIAHVKHRAWAGPRGSRASSTDFHATLSSATGQVIREDRFPHPWFSGSHGTYNEKVVDMALQMASRAPFGSIITIREDSLPRMGRFPATEGRLWRFKVVDMNGHRGVRKMRDLKKSRKG